MVRLLIRDALALRTMRVVALSILPIVLLSGCEDTPESRQARECKRDNSMPAIMSKHFVTPHLRSPSTAEFPSRPLQQAYIDTCTWQVLSYVDAQNAFGATVRTPYLITMIYDPVTRNWSSRDLDM